MAARDLDRIHFVTRHFNELKGLQRTTPWGLLMLGGGVWRTFPTPLGILCGLILLLGGILLQFAYAPAYYRKVFGEVDPRAVRPAAELQPVSIYNLASAPTGPGTGRPPAYWEMRRVVMTLALVLVIFSLLVTILPSVSVQPATAAERLQGETLTVSVSSKPGLTLVTLVQLIYVLLGSAFVGIWLWRERRLPQAYYLGLGVALLVVAVLGLSSGLVLSALWNLGIARVGGYLLPGIASIGVAEILCGASVILAGLLDHRQLVRALVGPTSS